jgi:protease IV
MIEILQTKAWALESRFFNQIAPLVLNRLAIGKGIEGLFRPEDNYTANKQSNYRAGKHLMYSEDYGFHYDAGDGSVIKRTSLKGTVSKTGFCGGGTSALTDQMLMADENPKVKAHILEIDSPGGAVDGTPEFASTVASLQKPVVAYIDNMAASAAYWIAAQADHIITNKNNYTQVGSIGTLAMLMNQGEYLKKEGIKVQVMRADQSKDKALLNSVEEWPEEALAELQQELNAITDDFVEAVKSGRNGKLMTWTENIFTGKMYDQKRALSLGMIDQIGTIEDAIRMAATYYKKKKN